MTAVKSDVPIALLSDDDCLPGRILRGVDCSVSKSEPIASFMEEVNQLHCLRASFQFPDASMSHNRPGTTVPLNESQTTPISE